MNDEELERLILERAREYNAPPPTPREELWAEIRERLPEPRKARGWRTRLGIVARSWSREQARRLPGWTPWAVGLAAATMAVGFGLGRVTTPVPTAVPPAQAQAAEQGTSLTVRMAAADHLGEAEALLTLYRASGGPPDAADDRAATARWARDLLATTRVLIDSRAGDDPAMAGLLSDLELVLAQIAGAASDPDEQELIEDGIAERQLISQLRSAAAPTGMSL